MAAALSQFEALCEATANFLNNVPVVTPAMQAQHATNIEGHMSRMQGRSELLSPRMLQLVRGLPLPAEMLDRLTARLSDLATAAATNGGLQNWTNWSNYITEEKAAELRAVPSSEQEAS